MNKSHLGTADNPKDVVTAHDIGQLVDVLNVGKGFLRYVGPIHGKDGLFCGVELLEPNGKHDGTHQGVSYFIATPNHGIFAPIFRVSLDQEERKKRELIPDSMKRLSRSALPSLNLRNTFTTSIQDHRDGERRQRNEDLMTTSVYATNSKPIDIEKNANGATSADPMQMSIFSDMMDGSMFSNGSWSDIADSMITSNCTFTVRKGPLIPNDDDSDLMSVPMVQSVFNIDREALRREEQLQSSMVIGESKIGVEYLPIIEDENELETPLVEVRPIQAEAFTTTPIINDVKVVEKIADNDADDDRQPPSAPHPLLPKNEQQNSIENSLKREESEGKKNQTGNSTTKTKTEMETRKTTKKPLTTSSTTPVQPKFPVKPKPPSKHQLMMEQLKASIEAEKKAPKKEVKSRVSLLPPPPPPPSSAPPPSTTTSLNSKLSKENREADATTTAASQKATKQAMKSSNKTKMTLTTATIPPAPVERQKKERKPLYVAPPPKKERVEKEKEKKSVAGGGKSGASTSPRSAEDKTSLTSSHSSRNSHNFPTSSFAGSKPIRKVSATTTTTTTKQSATKIGEAQKLERLQRASLAIDALIIVLRELNTKNERIEKKCELKIEEVGELKKLLGEMTRKLEKDAEEMKKINQDVVRKNAESVKKLQQMHCLQLAEKSKEMEKTLDDEKARRDAEMFAMSNRHQKVVACLDEKIAEAEKQCEELKIDKKKLQAALANDCDHRNQMLTKEISSLQTALEMKSAEMKELRQKNQNLSLQVDEIPLKELEISKWKHKANEYKQMLDQKIVGEKILVQQIEELRKKQMHDEEEKEAIRRNLDLMQFKYENGDEANVSSSSFISAPNESRFGTPTKVQFRSRSSASGTRPPSINISADNRLSNSSHGGEQNNESMNRSTISMYMSQIRLPENHADDVIYAPDEIISSRSGSISQRLSISIEDDGEPTLKSEINGQSDSGIGLVM